MNVLAIDSSNLVMGVAAVNDNKVLGEHMTNVKKNHSVRLMPAIEQLLNDLDLAPADIDRIAVAMGPGSYTGVRIGVTIAKMMAWTLNKELVGVSSLEIVAQNGRYFDGLIAPFFDARRGQVYAGLYKSERGIVSSAQADRLVVLKDWLGALAKLDRPVLFLSGDMGIHRETIRQMPRAVFAEMTMNVPRAAELGRLGLKKRPVADIHHFVPTYLRLAEAEAKWLAKQER